MCLRILHSTVYYQVCVWRRVLLVSNPTVLIFFFILVAFHFQLHRFDPYMLQTCKNIWQKIGALGRLGLNENWARYRGERGRTVSITILQVTLTLSSRNFLQFHWHAVWNLTYCSQKYWLTPHKRTNVIDLLSKLNIFVILSNSATMVSVGQNGGHCEETMLTIQFS